MTIKYGIHEKVSKHQVLFISQENFKTWYKTVKDVFSINKKVCSNIRREGVVKFTAATSHRYLVGNFNLCSGVTLTKFIVKTM